MFNAHFNARNVETVPTISLEANYRFVKKGILNWSAQWINRQTEDVESEPKHKYYGNNRNMIGYRNCDLISSQYEFPNQTEKNVQKSQSAIMNIASKKNSMELSTALLALHVFACQKPNMQLFHLNFFVGACTYW